MLWCSSVDRLYFDTRRGRKAVCLGLRLSPGTRLLLPSSNQCSNMFLLQPAAESLVVVDARVAYGCVAERPSMWVMN